MIIGQTIVAVNMGSDEPTTVYTPWIATAGNSAVFAYEILSMAGGNPALSVSVFTKNSEDTDPGTQKGSSSVETAPGTYTITDAAGLLELVRMKFVLTPFDEVQKSATAFATIRPLNPSWKTN